MKVMVVGSGGREHAIIKKITATVKTIENVFTRYLQILCPLSFP